MPSCEREIHYRGSFFESWLIIYFRASLPLKVSRCGMIYMEPASLGWKVQIDSWFNKFPDHLDDSHKGLLRALFERHVNFAYALISKKLVQELQSTSR